ncbi:MAG: NAD(P)-dependent oxidoreductase [Lunatimonas sp.]|uniref:NAD-dependent epimerase/dehydratase family protein n=1 Tax=Lunatimonas sp. TaxID=2060141 RepID=UPI00263BDEE8|nr:NAD(P)-dependent oxidoreductase [Lunatimonas sp.]MCC5935716.1 NAD(P)-dependent oxidoreductase [Lunatimonas sp.]
MNSLEELERKLATPSEACVADMARIQGDILVLGVGGKMGPSLAKLAVNALRQAGSSSRVIGVSRFSEAGVKDDLIRHGVEAISADILDDGELARLPKVENVIFMAGKKFGTSGNEHFTWAMNAYLPGRVAEHNRAARIVVFSSGNVYPFVPLSSGGATEDTPPGPVGEYAQSCLGRERIFQSFSHRYQIPMLIYRLNYAIDMRYGNLLEIAKMVYEEREIDVTNGYMNVIWQGDANEIALRSLLHCEAPAKILNVTGPEIVSIRWVAEEFGELFGKRPKFGGEEAPSALLNNAARCHRLFGYPRVTLKEMIEMTYEWVIQGGETFNKPTHFQERSGKY